MTWRPWRLRLRLAEGLAAGLVAGRVAGESGRAPAGSGVVVASLVDEWMRCSDEELSELVMARLAAGRWATSMPGNAEGRDGLPAAAVRLSPSRVSCTATRDFEVAVARFLVRLRRRFLV